MTSTISALIADDEPLLREILEARLAAAWPELQIVAQARNGRQAIELFEQHLPTICFLDMHMPGLNGIEVARHIGKRSHLVFVTAFDQYALDAFEHGVLDYLVKPVTAARLAETVERLKARTQTAQPAVHTEALLAQLAERLKLGQPEALRWLRATVGGSLRMIPVDDIDYLKSDTKYTLVAFRDEGHPAEALIRMPLKELIAQLDPQLFAQVHRSVAVNLRAIRCVTRGENETADIELKGRNERLPVSRSYLQFFKEM
ncbi:MULTISPECIES: LytTR family DNA-binding domain-containing protein [unclassified Duganella]|uniref:LytR/AlgR family response regulator transcription factor n=1 Tax=unclassified Duganella TaxID=2636909 RepID=UPI000E3563E5|nr:MULTISPECIES: LytTR family DNA-binding domain-containing protein [unclassified Duganella]RFP12609.1 DNA-binding response regulator [Duganella sp. BJB475]RFP28585.1 DNA-binding response regulator [Duganella sp. BJB476]